jgi:hypothetical protein
MGIPIDVSTEEAKQQNTVFVGDARARAVEE